MQSINQHLHHTISKHQNHPMCNKIQKSPFSRISIPILYINPHSHAQQTTVSSILIVTTFQTLLHIHNYRFTTYQDARRVILVDGTLETNILQISPIKFKSLRKALL